jgi:hypothetical protein
MKVEYTLPGLLPDPAPARTVEHGEVPSEPFDAHLRRLRAPGFKDWRAVLRLSTPPSGAAAIGPPPAPHGIDSREGASQRAWWRRVLDNHSRLLGSTAAHLAPATQSDRRAAVERMLQLLVESQRREDEIFARYFTEGAD